MNQRDARMPSVRSLCPAGEPWSVYRLARGGVGHAMGVNRMWRSWRIIQYDVFELSEESGEVVGTFATEDAEDRGDHLELERFQFSFFRLFRRVEPI